MGNRGMTNWKLSAFFVMSLMLIAAVFSNAAMAAANDGAGTVTVATGPSTSATILATVVASPASTDPLPAGSKFNALQFTYAAWTDANGNSTGDAGEEINMAGGRVRIAFPGGWTVSNTFVRVTDQTSVIYETDDMGKLDATLFPAGSDAETAANAAVSLSDANITINLGTEWGRGRPDVGRPLVIVLSDVTVGTAAGAAQFTSSSSARGGNLVRLRSTQPTVTVGNILGQKLVDSPATFSDPLDRTVEITPATVYPGEEDHRFTITFTAPGPMGAAADNGLAVTVPSDLLPDPFDATTIRVLGRGGASIGTPIFTAASGIIAVPLIAISAGQTVVITYTHDVPTTATNPAVNETSSFSAETTVDTRIAAVTKITGGFIGTVAGSGRVQLSPVSLEAGSKGRTFTVTYTAYTAVEGNIQITPSGIVLEDADTTDNVVVELQNTSSGAYGYVIGSASPSGNSMGTLAIDNVAGTITWQNVELKKNAKLTTTIRKVDVTEDAGNYEWVTMVAGRPVLDDGTTADVDEVARLSVVKTASESVKFEALGPGSYPAASKQTISFRFTAEATPIRDGSVWFTIPAALGSAPAANDADAETAGMVSASYEGGTLEGTKQTEWITVSGRTITVKIRTLDIGGSVTINYGIDGVAQSLLHNVAGDVKVIGNYRTSSGARPAGTAIVEITNVMDGAAGPVTIGPQQVEAGSNHGVVSVKFTALGTMDDGRVSLELPTSGWGTFQRDPAQRNYVQVSGNSNVSLEEPAVGESSNKAVAKITKLAAGQSFTFVYGGGSAGSANGAEVQDNIGVATFVIESDGTAMVVFARVFSEKEQTDTEKIVNPNLLGAVFMAAAGDLKVQVEAAADGTGVVVADPIIVRAAAADVKITFTYTSTQTIQDGELQFTVPLWMERAPGERCGDSGLHRCRWKRSRNR